MLYLSCPSVMRDVACQYWRPDAQHLHNQYHTFWHQIICKGFRQHSSSELAAENIVILQVIVAVYIWKCFCSIPAPPKFIFKSTHCSVNFEFPVQPIFHWWNLAQCVISISCYILYELSVRIQRLCFVVFLTANSTFQYVKKWNPKFVNAQCYF